MGLEFDFFDDITIYTNLDGNILKVNETFKNIIQKNEEELIGKEENNFLKIIKTSQTNDDIQKLKNKKIPFLIEEEINYSFGLRFYKTKKELIVENNQEKILITRKDITEYKQYLNLYHAESKILGYIARGESLEFILDEIIKSVEEKKPNMMCSVLLLDESKQTLVKCAAPSLPEAYSDKIDGMKIGEKVGSCGAAIYLKQRVIVDDITTHENWKIAKNLAAKYNLRACWSQPIFSSENEVLGSFAIYYNEPKKPSNFDIDLIENVANITGIAIEKHINNKKLKKEIEENKKQEQLLMHKSKQAMMGEMLENIAHQWRQPLSVISSYATGIMIKKEYGHCTKDLEAEAFETINLNAQYLSNTIENFRNFFLSNSQKSSFCIEETLDYTLRLMEARLKKLNIKLIKDIQTIKIFNYRNELVQVFMNIFNNSVDALEDIDEDKRYIQILSYKEDEDIIIQIKDSAKGVEQKVLDRIFEPYFTTKHQDYGTGIGLFMSQEIIVKHMKGTIEAKNSSFELCGTNYTGLKFTIKIPLKED